MNILIFEQHYTSKSDPGIARFSIFSNYWAQEGHKVNILSGMVNYISGKKPKKYYGRLLIKENAGHDITILRVFNSAWGYRTYLGRICSYFSFIISAFWGGLFAPIPDIIIVSSPPIFLGLVAYAISVKRKTPIVLDVRDLWPDVAVSLGFVKNKFIIMLSNLVEKYTYEKAGSIVVISPGMKEYLSKQKGVPCQKIEVVPSSVELDLINAAEKRGKENDFDCKDKFVIMYSGAHSAVYDFDSLLDVAKDLVKYKNIIFILAGDGRQKPHLLERINREKINNVLLVPPVSKTEVGKLLSMADVCVAPLKKLKLLRYGYATKIFDYMAMKKPIILAMEGEAAELVNKEANCGITIAPGNKEGLKKAILVLLYDTAKRKQLGENGFEYVKRHRSANELAHRYLKLLNANIKNRLKGSKRYDNP